MAANGARCVLVSGGFTFFTSRVAEAAGFHADRANTLIEADGALTGEVGEPILGREAKLAALQRGGRARSALPLSADPGHRRRGQRPGHDRGRGPGRRLSRQADRGGAGRRQVDHADLTALLYFQGYRADEFVTD